MRSGALAELGRMEEAKASTADTLSAFPNVSVEAMINEPGWTDAERKRFSDAGGNKNHLSDCSST